MLGDLEAGTGTLLRLRPGAADVVVVVAQPTAKAVDIAGRAVRIAASREARVLVVANRVRDEADLEQVRTVAGEHEVVAVPDDPAIRAADVEGVAPLDAAPDAPGVRALAAVAERVLALAPA